MKKTILLLSILVVATSAMAQPARRRAEQQAKVQRNTSALTQRAQISFPTAVPMSEDVVWRRDIYREVKLTDGANAGLYYPVEPQGQQMNLFCYMFKLMMKGQVPAYKYNIDGNEVFNDSSRIKPMSFLKDYHIYYERTDRGIRIEDNDIPSSEVKAYYVKECAYYDQATSTFHTKVVALCPIMKRNDDFGDFGDFGSDANDAGTQYPLFWMRYDDLAPFLVKQTIMTSDLNNAATMSIDDYFTEHLYKGKIYKTTNMLGKTLAQYCTNEAALTKEQQRIEKEIADFESHIWGDKAAKDSLDSLAKADKTTKKARKTTRRSGSSSASTTAKKSHRSSSSASSGAARVTVRRQRH